MKKEPPAIHTADGKPIETGMTLYGIDLCRGTVEKLTVIDQDLGARRLVRLRRKNGVEWTWSANPSHDACNFKGERFLYVSRAKAVNVSRARKRVELETKLATKVRELKDNQSQIANRLKSIERCEQSIESIKKQLADIGKDDE